MNIPPPIAKNFYSNFLFQESSDSKKDDKTNFLRYYAYLLYTYFFF